MKQHKNKISKRENSISERKKETKYEELARRLVLQNRELKRFERRLLTQFEVTKVLTEAENLSDAIPRILKVTCAAIDCQLGEVWLADKKRHSLIYGGCWYDSSLETNDFIKHNQTHSFELSEGFPGLIWKENKPVWISNLKGDKRFLRSTLANKFNLESGLGVPIKSEGKILGVMLFFNQNVSEPDGELLNMLESLGNQIGDFATRKKVEESLKDSEERFRLITENSKDLISMLSPEGKFIYVSPSHELLLGYTRDELLCMNLLTDLIHPDDLAKIANWQSTSMFEFRLRKKDGSWLWLEGMNYTVSHKEKAYIIGVSRDVTDRKKVTEALKTSEARLFGLIDFAMDAIITFNSDYNVVLFNKAAEKMFQYSAEDVLGKSINKFIPKRYRAIHNNLTDMFSKTGITAREMGSAGRMIGLRANKEEFPLETAISQLDVSGEKLFTIICHDVTQQQKYRTQIENSLREKEVLLKEIHHRVKNNLQVISSLLNLQSNFIEDERMADVFKESRNRVRLMALVHEKLYQSKDLSRINVAEYFKDLTAYLFSTYRMEPNAIKLKLDIEDIYMGINFAINLGLITNELISNSLKHAFPDKRRGEIGIKMYSNNDDSLTLEVKDNGVGFPDNLNYTSTKSLGLQLVNSLVLQYRGTIEFQSKEGTRYKIMFKDIKTNGLDGSI
jgi:PAS domain S-box-containing protein